MLRFENCTRIGCPSQYDWSQYGQDFINIGDQPRIFLVEPFRLGKNYADHTMKPLCSNNQQVWHFFQKWLDDGVNERNWLEKNTRIPNDKYKDFFHILSYGDNPRETMMEGYDEPGFKYRVEYNGSWTCTCIHFYQLGRNVCCKHINACIGVATSTARLGWPLERSQFVVDDVKEPEEHLGLRDIVVEITPDSVESGSDMDLSSDAEFDMVPVFKHWLA